MLLGEHEHSLDDKNRLTLPAKLRAAFEDGVVVTRGLDGCLFAYPRVEWEGMVTRLRSLDPLAEYRGEVETTEPLPFGIHAAVAEPGRIRLGDPVSPL